MTIRWSASWRCSVLLLSCCLVMMPTRGSTTSVDLRNVTLPVLALLDLSSADGRLTGGGSLLLRTAQTAVAEVNRRQLIPGHHLQLLVNDSKCDSGAGVDAFFHAIYATKGRHPSSASYSDGRRPFMALLGPHCSHVTESVAGVTSYWNVVQVSHAATSAGLSDRVKFPNFFRTVAAESSHNPARLNLLQHFRWEQVSILVQNEDDYSLAVNDWSALLDDANITVSNFLTFAPDELTDQFQILKDKDARIIVGSFSPSLAVPILCEVKEKVLYGPDHVWILPGSLFKSDRWLEQLFQQISHGANVTKTCRTKFTRKDLIRVMEGHFFLRPYPHPVNVSHAGQQQNFETFPIPRQNVPSDEFHGEIYDAIWTIALGLRGLQEDYSRPGASSLSDFTYARKDMADKLMSKIAALRFQGASGLVSFHGADRIGTTALFQIQNGVAKQVGLFHPDMGLKLNESSPVFWLSGQPPVATRIIKYRIVAVAPAAFIAITSLSVLGILFALACLTFNLLKRKLKCIKLSSPKLNNMAIVGSVLIYVAVIFMGLDHGMLSGDWAFRYVCMGRVYFLAVGFSLAFGAMFAKTFRVHRIFSMRNSLIKNKLLADKQLIGLILSLLLMDTLLIGLWVALDPLERHLYNLPMVVDSLDRRVVYQPQAEVCRSNRSAIWVGILYAKKGLLLVGGVYMAWETRKVAIPALNDSPYIGMNVYNVVLTSIIVVFCGSLLTARTTLYYIVVSTLILTSTTTALCLLFLPKFHAVWKQANGGATIDPICQSTGLKLEFNTRRMVVDDRKELMTRAEIMNRVYLKEIAKLDADIQRLERILDRELNSSVLTLDDYRSAIQVEVTQLYDKLEADQEPDEVGGRSSSPGTWHLRPYIDRLISRSCNSLLTVGSTGKKSGPTGATTTTTGWGSVSCIDQSSCPNHLVNYRNSLITLLNLTVDEGGDVDDAVYQLVDKSLLGDSLVHRILRGTDAGQVAANEILLSL